MQTTRSLHITIQSILFTGSLGIITLYLVLLHWQLLGPGELLGTSPINLIIAGIHVVYFALIRLYLNQKSLVAATAIDLSLFSVNLAILLLVTGGLASPYFMFWLLSTLFAAATGRYGVGLFILITLLYFGINTFLADNPLAYAQEYLVHIAATLVAGGLGVWLWRHHPVENSDSSNQVAGELAEKLQIEQLKSDILLKSIGDGVIVIDLSGNIQLYNPPSEDITGWPEDEAVGIHYQQVMPLEDEEGNRLEGQKNPFHQAIMGKQRVKRKDIVIVNRNQKKLNLALTVAPIFASANNVTGAVAVFSDISNEKQSARQRDEFISTASHEMRTPVAAIEGFLALAMNPKVSNIDENAQKYIQKAYDSTQHLGKLFRDLLSITKLEDGRIKNNPEPFELGKIIKAAVDELQFKAEQKSLDLKLKSSQSAGNQKGIMPLYYVNADPERVREVFVNLVDNAIKFTPQGEVNVSIEGDEREVTVGVHDQGVGIPEDEVKHLFQKFYRVDNSKTREIGGTGLGLYLSRTIIEMYGGRIWVESEEGKGSSFYFTLPRLTYSQAQELRDKLEKQKSSQQADESTQQSTSTAPPAATAPEGESAVATDTTNA